MDRKTASSENGRAARLHDWLELQLSLVDVLVDRCGMPVEQAATYYTNFHRRFGFGRPGEQDPSAEWNSFLLRLSSLEARSERVEWTKEFGRDRLISDLPIDRPAFGCFNFDQPNEKGVVRIHFSAQDTADGSGPLSRPKAAIRRRELAEMFESIRGIHGARAQFVVGASWLYNIEAYRRLFPQAFTESRTIFKSPTITLSGMPFWGQFLDHQENIKPLIRDQFLSNLEHIDMSALWKLFPMPLMITRAPIAAFYEFYSM